jgi:hypothetical protein
VSTCRSNPRPSRDPTAADRCVCSAFLHRKGPASLSLASVVQGAFRRQGCARTRAPARTQPFSPNPRVRATPSSHHRAQRNALRALKRPSPSTLSACDESSWSGGGLQVSGGTGRLCRPVPPRRTSPPPASRLTDECCRSAGGGVGGRGGGTSGPDEHPCNSIRGRRIVFPGYSEASLTSSNCPCHV